MNNLSSIFMYDLFLKMSNSSSLSRWMHVTFSNDTQYLNDVLSIEIAEVWIVKYFNEMHPSKAFLSIFVTEIGNSIWVNEEHSLKVPTPIDEINEFIVTWLKLMHLSKE